MNLAIRETVIYIRVSSQEQNPFNQLKDCEKIRPKDAKTETFVDYSLIEDKQSAFLDFREREGFSQLCKLIKRKKVRNLIVWDLDRIYRNRLKLVEFFKLCKAYRCRIYSFNQKWLEDIAVIPQPFNEIVHDLMIQVLGWIAEDESKRKSERVKSAMVKRKGEVFSRNGNKWGRKKLSAQKRNKIINFKKDNPDASIRMIAKEIGLSHGVVHKILVEYSEV